MAIIKGVKFGLYGLVVGIKYLNVGIRSSEKSQLLIVARLFDKCTTSLKFYYLLPGIVICILRVKFTRRGSTHSMNHDPLLKKLRLDTIPRCQRVSINLHETMGVTKINSTQ